MLTLATLAAGVVGSEFQFREEVRTKPVRAGEHYLAHQLYSSQSPTQHLIVFLHGWPDDMSMFGDLAERLAKAGYSCATCNLPGYPVPPGFRGVSSTIRPRKWGFTFDEAVIGLKSTVDKLLKEGGFSKVTLVTHDWGAIVGYLFDQAYPSFVHRMVSLDIGWRLGGPNIFNLLFAVLYQGILNLCFLLPSALGTIVTNRLASALGRRASVSSGPVDSMMNWPYRAAWRDMATRGAIKRMDAYKPSKIPRLFLYAKETSPTMRFSDEEWYWAVKNSCEGISDAKAIKGGHWMLIRNAEQVSTIILDWMQRSDLYT